MTYYRVDLRNLTFGELWRMAKLAFPITVLLKIFRIPMRLRQAFGVPPTPIRVDDHELDLEGRRARIQRDLDLLEQAGLRYRFPYKVPMVSPESTTLGVGLLDDEGRIAGVVTDAVTRIGAKTQALKQVALSTPMRDGRVLVTSSRSFLLAPPNVEEEVVRTGTTRLIARHAERLREAISGVRFVPQDGLLGYLEEREREAADFHIQRRVYVPMSDAAVDKLRGRKARGVGWQLGQKALAWVVGIALGLSWAFGGIGSCSSFVDEPDVESMVADVTFSSVDCSTWERRDGADPAAPQVTTVVASFPSPEAASSALEAARDALRGEGADEGPRGELLLQLDRTVFYRLSEGTRAEARPIYEQWKASATSTSVLGGANGQVAPSFVVTLDLEQPEAEGFVLALESYLSLSSQFMLKPPWAPASAGGAVSDEQENARRTVRLLQEAQMEALTDAWGSVPLAILRTLWDNWTGDEEDWMEDARAMQEEQAENLRERADQLLEEDPDLDRRTVDLFLAWQKETQATAWGGPSASDPFAETDPATVDAPSGESEALRELRDRLGGLHYRRDEQTGMFEVEGPLEPYTASWGWVERSDERLAGRMSFADPAVAAPAVLGWLCSDGAVAVSYGFAEEAW